MNWLSSAVLVLASACANGATGVSDDMASGDPAATNGSASSHHLGIDLPDGASPPASSEAGPDGDPTGAGDAAAASTGSGTGASSGATSSGGGSTSVAATSSSSAFSTATASTTGVMTSSASSTASESNGSPVCDTTGDDADLYDGEAAFELDSDAGPIECASSSPACPPGDCEDTDIPEPFTFVYPCVCVKQNPL